EVPSRQIASAVPCLDTHEFSFVTCQNVKNWKKSSPGCRSVLQPEAHLEKLFALQLSLGSHIPFRIKLGSHRTVKLQGMTTIELEWTTGFWRKHWFLLFAPLTRHGLHRHGRQNVRKL